MEHYDKNFLGRNGFQWFMGVVEDRLDPQYTGRVRVRCLGYHTGNKITLPTSDLPWAQVVLPITSSGISGIGQTPLGLVEGSWVFGYFRDNACQEPVVIGSLPGKPEELAQSGGFYDPAGIYPKYKNEPDVNRLAVNNEDNPHLALTLRKATRITGIATADFNPITAADGSLVSGSDGDTWNQPEIPYNASYPYNHVYESESGHIREYDDTPNAKRILEYHASGTEYEIANDGTRNTIIKGADYKIVESDDKIYIKGDSDITLGGRHKIIINADGAANNNYDIQVGPNANVNIQVDQGNINLTTLTGKINMYAGDDYNLTVGGNMNVLVNGNIKETAFGTSTKIAQREYHTYGNPIDHN